MTRFFLAGVLAFLWAANLAGQALPAAATPNVWYRRTDSPTAIVFIHGILSDIRGAWLDPAGPGRTPAHYWPEMVADDPQFNGASVYLAGYFTAPGAGNYDIRQSAMEVRDGLVRNRVLDKENILFIAHSTGGIVLRHMLTRDPELFEGRNVGVALIASPSLGSYWADRADLLARLFGNQMARQLRRGDPFLAGLHSDFRELLMNRRLRITGIERCENQMVLPVMMWFDRHLVVDPASCSTYFGAARILPATNHFTAVKPDGPSHPAYVAISDFYRGAFAQLVESTPRMRVRIGVSLQPIVQVRRDTTVQFAPVEFLAPTCETAVQERTFSLPHGWKLIGVAGPTPVQALGTGSGVSVQRAGESVVVTARAGATGTSPESCTPGRVDYVMAMTGIRLDDRMGPALDSAGIILDSEHPRQTIAYRGGAGSDGTRQWVYRVTAAGTTARGIVFLQLSEQRPEVEGIHTHVTADGQLVVDGSGAFR